MKKAVLIVDIIFAILNLIVFIILCCTIGAIENGASLGFALFYYVLALVVDGVLLFIDFKKDDWSQGHVIFGVIAIFIGGLVPGIMHVVYGYKMKNNSSTVTYIDPKEEKSNSAGGIDNLDL